MKNVVIIGSTGSIGRQTVDVIRAFPDKFNVVALSAGANVALLKEQCALLKPDYINYTAVPDSSLNSEYRQMPSEEMASLDNVDVVVVASPGGAGLKPTLSAAASGKIIALANKESLVTAGKIIFEEALKSGAKIYPVDSEHSAIWQCLTGEASKPKRLILTASGGPFRNLSKDELKGVTAEQALKHPSWKMGEKVTIDSATLMNKGLEIIEANRLFNIPFDKINVVVHPQSIVHSVVEFEDGVLKAQMGAPDMRTPIQYALTYPERWENKELPVIDFTKLKSLDFEAPDYDKFPCLKLARQAGEKGGTYPAVLCGADEMAVRMFLCGKIGFTDIAEIVEKVLNEHSPVSSPSLEQILAAEEWARNRVRLLGETER